MLHISCGKREARNVLLKGKNLASDGVTPPGDGKSGLMNLLHYRNGGITVFKIFFHVFFLFL